MSVSKLPQRVTFLEGQHIGVFQKEIDDVIDDLYETYSGDSSRNDFDKEFYFQESVHMRIASFRLASLERMNSLKSKAIAFISNSFELENDRADDSSYLLHPLFHLRVVQPDIYCLPGEKLTNKLTPPIFTSEPHYDTSYGLYQHFFWIAVDGIDAETGGACLFEENAEILKHFSAELGNKNSYNYESYLENYEELDSLLQPAIIQAVLEPGEAYWLDSSILHGGTNPRTRVRMSFDFRIIPNNSINQELLEDLEVIHTFNQFLEFSNSMNLITLGDEAGALLQTPNLRDILERDDLSAYARFDPHTPGQQVHWRELYSWLEDFDLKRLCKVMV